MVFNGQPGRKCGREHERVGADCGLHPLIHTLLKFNVAQDIVACQREEKESPHRPEAWPMGASVRRYKGDLVGVTYHYIILEVQKAVLSQSAIFP